MTSKYLLPSAICFLLLLQVCRAETNIRVNQLGYLPKSVKVAVLISDEKINVDHFQLVERLSNKVVFEGATESANGTIWGKKTAYRLRFSDCQTPGAYVIRAGQAESPSFVVGDDVYHGTADFILNYMRQQRCGFNPFLNDHCHQHDGIIVDHPTRTGESIDVTGGWHDASDYLQYTTTSANAVYQMLFAYQENPAAFGDKYKADGTPGANGVHDVLDEARWGLEWLLKMNPAKNEMYNQIADDRDHQGYRLPNKDDVSYDLPDNARPVYFVTGKSQGLRKNKNRSTGVASIASKFASSFALGAETFREVDPQFSEKMKLKAKDAWDFAKSDLGVCQTACTVSPYFYEEDNYIDDMELAAATFAFGNGQNQDAFANMLTEAKYWGALEPVTPWMGLHHARHYQYYPFVNLGHALLARSDDPAIAGQFAEFMKQGLEHLKKHADNDPFQIGVPFIWCSNNLVVAAATEARLYRQVTGDRSFEEMEAAHVDWLFGCNPWGTSMICGLPTWGDSPDSPHSAITYLMHQTTTGGLVDGPVYKTIYETLKGIHLFEADEYANFQAGKAVYHDDMGDYSSNEPTMDGTACLSYLLSSLETEGQKNNQNRDQNSDQKNEGQATDNKTVRDQRNAIVRFNPDEKKVYTVFSGHDFVEGGTKIAQTLKEENVRASFFFTGVFYDDPANRTLITTLKNGGHYLVPHSDQHLLYRTR